MSIRRHIVLSAALISALICATGCLTYVRNDQGEEVLASELYPTMSTQKEEEPRAEDFSIATAWSQDDRAVPIALAGIPNGVPVRFAVKDVPEPGDQGAQRSGTAFAVANAVSAIQRRKGLVTYQCAPAFIYNQLANGRDSGIEIIYALQLASSTGCPDEGMMPYRPNDYMSQPSSGAVGMAARTKILSFGRVDFTDINQVKAHLLQGNVVVVNLRITDNFMSLKDAIWKNPGGQGRGRHTVTVVGYDDAQGVFIIQNSAGKSWGNNGYAGIPYGWFVRVVGQAYAAW